MATLEVPRSVEDTARMLGWQGPGSRTSPAYETVLRACQRGDLPAVQVGGRKCRWMIRPSDAIAWRLGKRPGRKPARTRRAVSCANS